MPHLELKNLHKTFRQPGGASQCAVSDLSLAVESKELLVLAGPSGCGKTTTLRLIAGLEAPDAGEILLDGRALNPVPAAERDVALVFQSRALLPHLNAFDNLALGLRLRNAPRAEVDRRVHETADWLGITACLARRPAELSGGEQQRVALGRALVRRPGLFLLDEPLTHLDGALRRDLRAVISALPARFGAPVICVTHDPAEAMTLGQRLAIMRAGALQQIDLPLGIYRKPVNTFVAGFLGSPAMNLLPGRLHEESGVLRWRSQAGSALSLCLDLTSDQVIALAELVGQELIVGLRPEDLEVALSDVANAGNTVPVRLKNIEALGSETFVRVELGGLDVVARAPATFTGAAGDSAFLQVAGGTARYFEPQSGRAIA